MNQMSTQHSSTPLSAEIAGRSSRLYFVDYLRAALVTLVVVHHLAVIYGEGISFWYVDPPQEDSLTGFLLVLFVLMNQAWFMGALFLLAGYFTPASYDRKGAGPFLLDRLVRLGIPLLIWMFIFNPFSNIGLYLEPVEWIPGPFTWEGFWRMYPHFIGLGVAWFLALLLIFSFGYAGWRAITGTRTTDTRTNMAPPTYISIGLFIVGLAVTTYLLRTLIPIGKTVLDFPTLAYLPQYLSFFIVGGLGYQREWLRTIPDRMGKVCMFVAVVATLMLFPFPILGIIGGTMRFLGNGSWPSAVYALWDSIFAVCISVAAITYFRRYFAQEIRLGRFLSQQSYAVYVIHSPLLIVLAYGFYIALTRTAIELSPFLKFVVACAVMIPLCFFAAYILRRIPGVSRVL